MRKLKCGALALLWPVMSCFAQNAPPQIKPLTIGDTVPDLVLTNVINYPVSEIRLSDLKGKLVILDFWATWCGACLAGIPKAQELQKQFKDKVQIVLVNSDTSENAAKVVTFLDRRSNKTGQKLTLPYAVQNAIFNDYFPHKEVPHYVWINEAGKINGITTADEVTPENISAFLEDSSKILYTKKDHLRFNPDKPLLIDENGGDNPTGFIYRSIFTGFKEYLGASLGSVLEQEDKTIRYFILNSNLSVFLQIAYREIFKDYGPERIHVETPRYSRESILDPAISQLPENRFCYEIILPTVSQDEIKTYLQQDIMRTFGITAKSDKRTLDCYVMKAGKAAHNLRTKGDNSNIDIAPTTLKKQITNQPINALINVLQATFGSAVVDETGIDYNIDISFPSDFLEYSSSDTKAFLEKKGLTLSPSKKELEVVVITDKQ